MELDDVDRSILASVLEDASRSLREIADEADVTAPTVSSRLDRMEELGILGPARRDVDLTRLGTLVLILAPPDARDALSEHETVFQVHRSQSNEAIGLALVDDGGLEALHAAFPNARTHVLTERLRTVTPRVPGQAARSHCAECGKTIEGEEGIEVLLGDNRYLVCCPMCQERIKERYEEHQEQS